MIASAVPMVAELLVAFCLFGAAWVLGVGFAVYRAVGWTERMRAWAAAVADAEQDGGPQIAEHLVDAKGVN